MQDSLVVKEVNTGTWQDLEELFEARGGPRNCWCMVWRSTGEEAKHTDGPSRKSFLKTRIDAGTPVGILAYKDGKPIAWCSVAPKETYRRLEAYPVDSDSPSYRFMGFVGMFQAHGFAEIGLAGTRRHVMRLRL